MFATNYERKGLGVCHINADHHTNTPYRKKKFPNEITAEHRAHHLRDGNLTTYDQLALLKIVGKALVNSTLLNVKALVK